MDTPRNDLHHAVRDAIARAVAVIGLMGMALIHLLDISGKFSETPYMAWMYIGLIASALAIGFMLIHRSSALAWLAAGGLAASAMLGFVLTRTVGLPQAHGDIGNWTEPLGLASLFVEGTLIALAGVGLALRRAAATGRTVVGSIGSPSALRSAA
jgi:hypothetical protein